jgi:hypothetical protein
MSQYFGRSGGQVYGPYAQEQLASLAASGRVTPTTEVSTDRVNWVPAATLQGGGAGGPKAAPASSGDPARYLERLRGRTNYPTYRAVVLIFSVLGYIAAALPTIGVIVTFIMQGAVEFFENQGPVVAIACFFGSALGAVLVKFYQEFATMLVDFTDSTIDHHARH